uniref:CP n=1 Tax=Manihot esculenta associated ampelovirus 2 TaxID=2843332 RepID=A0A8F0FQX6_9CLOS|nr:CP [Manihot esculenta associated ampelovirus 2]
MAVPVISFIIEGKDSVLLFNMSTQQQPTSLSTTAPPTSTVFTVVPGGSHDVSTFADLFATTSSNVVLDLSKIAIPRMLNVAIPGVVQGVHKKEAALALQNLAKSKNVPTDDKSTIEFIRNVLQLFVTYSTSPKVNGGSRLQFMEKTGNVDVVYNYDEIKSTLDNAIQQYGYENCPRQFGRSATSFIVQALSNGIMEPNVKVCVSHGIPPQYYPYSPDCLLVDARVYGYDATLVSELGKMVAINKSSASKSNPHNMFEDTGVAPDIFMGGRR